MPFNIIAVLCLNRINFIFSTQRGTVCRAIPLLSAQRGTVCISIPILTSKYDCPQPAHTHTQQTITNDVPHKGINPRGHLFVSLLLRDLVSETGIIQPEWLKSFSSNQPTRPSTGPVRMQGLWNLSNTLHPMMLYGISTLYFTNASFLAEWYGFLLQLYSASHEKAILAST